MNIFEQHQILSIVIHTIFKLQTIRKLSMYIQLLPHDRYHARHDISLLSIHSALKLFIYLFLFIKFGRLVSQHIVSEAAVSSEPRPTLAIATGPTGEALAHTRQRVAQASVVAGHILGGSLDTGESQRPTGVVVGVSGGLAVGEYPHRASGDA